MTQRSGDELDDLRKRAYGPGSDIDDDPRALARLRQLEDEAQRLRAPAPAQAEADDDAPPAPTAHAEPGESAVPDQPATAEHPFLRALRAAGGWVATRRRSTLVMLAGAILVVAAMAVTLVVVQRVQTDPLQAGAVQVARLQPDASYELPVIFGYTGDDGASGAQAYEEFHGLRFVVADSRTVFGRSENRCLTVFGEAAVLDPNSQSFSGVVYSGCSAGDFPPVVQFTLAQEELPRQLRDALAGAVAVQLVYDAGNDEIVVFTD